MFAPERLSGRDADYLVAGAGAAPLAALPDACPAAAASGSTGAGVGAAAGAVCAGAAAEASTVPVRLLTAASVASAMQQRMKSVARMAVARVRKSAAPRADIRPDGPPPVRPPPSERCIRITATSAVAMIAWTTRRKVNMIVFLFRKWRAP